jgi:hypothetical protein
MKTKTEVDQDILSLLSKIKEEFPELLKYILEMPITVKYSKGDVISVENLTDYHSSLEKLVEKYALEHTEMTKKK